MTTLFIISGEALTLTNGICIYYFYLMICNVGSKPTFVIKNRKGVLNITLEMNISDEHSFSDHRFIDFWDQILIFVGLESGQAQKGVPRSLQCGKQI